MLSQHGLKNFVPTPLYDILQKLCNSLNRIKQAPSYLSAIDNAIVYLCERSAKAGEGRLLYSMDVCVLNRLHFSGRRMLYKRWKAFLLREAQVRRSSEKASRLAFRGIELDFRRRPSGGVCKPPYAAGGVTASGGER
jgi:hypothetical protein